MKTKTLPLIVGLSLGIIISSIFSGRERGSEVEKKPRWSATSLSTITELRNKVRRLEHKLEGKEATRSFDLEHRAADWNWESYSASFESLREEEMALSRAYGDQQLEAQLTLMVERIGLRSDQEAQIRKLLAAELDSKLSFLALAALEEHEFELVGGFERAYFSPSRPIGLSGDSFNEQIASIIEDDQQSAYNELLGELRNDSFNKHVRHETGRELDEMNTVIELSAGQRIRAMDALTEIVRHEIGSGCMGQTAAACLFPPHSPISSRVAALEPILGKSHIENYRTFLPERKGP